MFTFVNTAFIILHAYMKISVPVGGQCLLLITFYLLLTGKQFKGTPL